MRLKRGLIYDVTRALSPGMWNWPGDAPVAFQRVDFPGVNQMTNLSFSAHAGTHVDGASHMIKGGSNTDGIDFDKLTGLARVVTIPQCEIINREILKTLDIDGVSRLLLKTSNSERLSASAFDEKFTALSGDGAQYLVEKSVKFIATDYLSIDVFESRDYPAHKTLMGAGAVVVEGVDLTNVPAGDYEMLCLPLKLEGCDGAPARLLLRSL